jgi:hypothetical protein
MPGPAGYQGTMARESMGRCTQTARLAGENIMELICVPWTILVALICAVVVCCWGWALTVDRWHTAAKALLRQFEEEDNGQGDATARESTRQ